MVKLFHAENVLLSHQCHLRHLFSGILDNRTSTFAISLFDRALLDAAHVSSLRPYSSTAKFVQSDEYGSRTSPPFSLLVHLSIIHRRFLGRGLLSVGCRPSPRYIESNNESAASGSAYQWGAGYRRSTGQRYCWCCRSSVLQCRSATAAEYI